MSAKTVRQRFVKEFRNLSRNTERTATLIVFWYMLQIAVTMAAGWWLLQAPFSILTGAGLAVIVIFIGTRLRGINNIVHECSHFAFCESRENNVLFGRFCASMLLNCFQDYREEHLSHHAHLGDYDHDLDFQRLRSLRLEEPLTPRTVLRHVLTALSGLHIPYYATINLRDGDGAAFRLLKLGLIAAAILFLVLAPVAAIVLVWLPFLWAYPAINYLTDCIDHGGLVESEDELEASRNLVLPRQLRAILFPRNDCYHLIHHLFPQVPVKHFDACHEQLLAHPEYRARTHAPALGSGLAATGAKKRAGIGGLALE